VASNSDWVARVKRIPGVAFVEQGGEKSPLKVHDRLPAEAVVITGPNSPLTNSASSDSICSSSFMLELTDVDEATVCGSG
jgi:hypothetical protein